MADETVKYVVDQTGAGTHRTVRDALTDAKKNPGRVTLITIRPQVTIESFEEKTDVR